MVRDQHRVYYVHGAEGAEITIPYVGVGEPPGDVPANVLARVSLARSWARDEREEERRWLQLSGIY